LLCGYPPFNGSSKDIIMKKVLKGEFEFESMKNIN
jgi:hypothetical protein